MFAILTLTDLVPVLQLAIGPVIVISGVGLVVLSMTNRYGRVIDRVRALCETQRLKVRDVGGQLAVLLRRARLLRTAIFLAVICLVLATVVIILLFVAALAKIEIAAVIAAMFISSMASFSLALLYFCIEVNASLVALQLEIKDSPLAKEASRA